MTDERGNIEVSKLRNCEDTNTLTRRFRTRVIIVSRHVENRTDCAIENRCGSNLT